MRVVYMGTPAFAIPALDGLIGAGHEIAAVVTQPDQPVGRKRNLTPPAMKKAAIERGLFVCQPSSARSSAFLEKIRSLAPDLVAYAAYGKILPPAFLELPPLGCLNIHASLLPKYRGAAPIQWAIMKGETVTGVTIMRADAGLDTGPLLAMEEESIRSDDTAGALAERLSHRGARLLVDTIRRLEQGDIRPIPQNDSEATFAPILTAETASLDWSHSARAIRNKVRGLNPKPGAMTVLAGKEVKVWRVEEASLAPPSGAAPGTVVAVGEAGPIVATGDGSLVLAEVQPAGSRRMPGSDFARGHRLAAGETFTSGRETMNQET